MKKEKIPRARVMWFCTNCYAINGVKILTFDEAKAICEAHATQIEKYCLIPHDIDVHDEQSIAERESHRKQTYMEIYKKLAKQYGVREDATSESGYVYDNFCEVEAHKWQDFYYPSKKVGDAKELHIHVVLKFKNARALNEIAKWFNIPVNMIDIVKGRRSFEDCAEYLIHKKQPEKAQYDPSKVAANFNYIEWLENQLLKDELHEKYHMAIDDINDVINKVATEGLSLKKVEEMISPPMFLRNKGLFINARGLYIFEHMPMPTIRIVFYVDGNGKAGAGKSVATKALCKLLAKEFGADPSLDIGQLREYIYKAGQKGVPWDKYDGQPIVYIDDRTAVDMLREFNDHDGVKNLFERFPEKETISIKYGITCVVAKYIIINGIQSYTEFVNGLNGTYKSKNGETIESDKDITQYTRRITGILQIKEEEIVALFNKGVMLNTKEYDRYIAVHRIKYNTVRAVQTLKGNALYKVEEKALQPVISKTKDIEYMLTDRIEDPDDIPAEFLSYGDVIDDGECNDMIIDSKIMKLPNNLIEDRKPNN